MDSADRKANRDAYLAWAGSLGDPGGGVLVAGLIVSEASLEAACRELGGTGATEDTVYARALELDHLPPGEAHRRTAAKRQRRG